ncbi:MAG: carboxymuconolactone decarboxylase family protein [Polyangiaceae bacterium]
MSKIVPDVLPYVSEAEARGKVKDLYESVKTAMGSPFVPNFLAALGHSSASLQVVHSMITQLLSQGAIPPPVKMMLILAVAASKRCEYCTASHLVACKMSGIDQETIDRVAEEAERESIAPPKLQRMISFCVKAAMTPQDMTPEDYQQAYDVGCTHEEVVELVSMAAYATYAIILTDAMAVPVDDAYTQAMS